MAKKFSDLTEHQVNNFHAELAKVGINHHDIMGVCVTGEQGNKEGTKVGHELAHSDVEPAAVTTVDSVQHLKQLTGIPDHDYHSKKYSDGFVHYPKQMRDLAIPTLKSCKNDVCELKNQMSPAQHREVGKALHAYIKGDSTKVADYEDHINAIHFPMTVTSYAAEDLIITKDKPLIVDSPNDQPVHLVYGTITVEPGGYILAKVPLKLSCQVFTVNS